MFERSSNEGHIETLKEIVSQARSEFKILVEKDADTALVLKGDPEFMHNLVFRYVWSISFVQVRKIIYFLSIF